MACCLTCPVSRCSQSRRISHAALGQRDPDNLKSEIELEKAEGTERSRDRARHRHRQVRSPLQRCACVACKRVLAQVCISSCVDEPAKMLLFALHHVLSKGSVPYCNCGIWTEYRQAPTRPCIQWLGQCSRRSAESVMNVGCPVAFLDALLPFLDSDRGARCRAHGRHLSPCLVFLFSICCKMSGLFRSTCPHAAIRSEGA